MDENKNESNDIGIMAFIKNLESKNMLNDFESMKPAVKDSFTLIAGYLKMLYNALLTQGFTEEQALMIINFQAIAVLNPDIFKGNKAE